MTRTQFILSLPLIGALNKLIAKEKKHETIILYESGRVYAKWSRRLTEPELKALNDGKWHYIVKVINNNKTTLYVDGEFIHQNFFSDHSTDAAL